MFLTYVPQFSQLLLAAEGITNKAFNFWRFCETGGEVGGSSGQVTEGTI
jgi:hypothetical protein